MTTPTTGPFYTSCILSCTITAYVTQIFHSITYSLVPVLKKRWAEYFAEKAREFVKKSPKVNGQGIVTGSNCGMQLPEDSIQQTIPCPLQRTSTQGTF